MTRQLIILIFLFSFQVSLAQEAEGTEDPAYQAMVDSIDASFHYDVGSIELENGLATLTVPDGYRFLDAEQSAYVLENLWGNPPAQVIGLLFPKDITPLGDGFTYVVSISFSEEGYIDDEDAKELDYDELLEGMIGDMEEANDQRISMGYGSLELAGWASPPFYDESNKKLHWAKDLIFDDSPEHTLNYNIRILGRRGYLELNVIGSLGMLPLVNEHVDDFLTSVEFNEGHTYAEFDPDIDEIAAYGIGGLIAGKVLLKVGLLAGFLKFFKVIGIALLKFWKPIAIGLAAAGAAIKKFFFTTPDDDEADENKTLPQNDDNADIEVTEEKDSEIEGTPDDNEPHDDYDVDREVTDADFEGDSKDK